MEAWLFEVVAMMRSPSAPPPGPSTPHAVSPSVTAVAPATMVVARLFMGCRLQCKRFRSGEGQVPEEGSAKGSRDGESERACSGFHGHSGGCALFGHGKDTGCSCCGLTVHRDHGGVCGGDDDGGRIPRGDRHGPRHGVLVSTPAALDASA